MSLAVCALLFAQLGQLPEEDAAATKAASLERIVRDLESFELSVVSDSPEKLALSGDPVLRWNYPIRNVDDAALFVWLGKDRPEVVSTVMSYRDGKGNLRRAYEFLSVSQNALEAQQKGGQVWHPAKPGFTWQPLPEASVPARTPAERKRQMHDLAAKFQVAVQSEDNRYELRLLTKPLYRYQSATADILDGCLFAFVEGTDPELILAIESSADAPHWKFATGRLTRFRIEVRFDNNVLTEFPQMAGTGQISDTYLIPEGGPLDAIEK